MKKQKPRVVFIGGIETGKTSTIQMLWEKNVVDYDCVEGVHCFSIQEILEGRGFVDFEVYELPRINYTSTEWITKPGIKQQLESADVIVYVLTCDEVSVGSRREYMVNMFNKIRLKKDVMFIIAYGMADWVLFPEQSRNFQIPENLDVKLPAITNLLKKVSLVNSEFGTFAKYDKTFSVSSIIPYSNVIDWNVDELKYQIWNGIVVGLNELVYDESLPTVVLSGKTGCGKTSTINVLWNKNFATDRSVSCTKFPAVMRIDDVYNGRRVSFNLVDLPGIAESIEANSLYRHFYYKYINKASLLLCLTQADRRAYKQDQLFYSDLISNNILRKNQKVILGINQADLLFKSVDNLDGVDLHSINDDDEILKSKVDDFYDNVFADIFISFENVTKNSVAIYSVFQKWHLDNLKNKLYSLIF